ncbi:FHA domain-containing protein [Cellulomonas soli]|uniref:FHA domain-containing protein n=1 Tax=Cellulomonas soli TaxID=931535 RepID=A0A512PDB4_9CELL|nr:FHA domain-containing protein [Cellulomonas soli]NYI60152.1 hypothetical protein [Cellulomonas soli]GEP69195.1 hypothetical protein CSO01_19100 [Cellulomonas soli]
MIVPEYVPGRWTAVVTGGSVALVGPHTRPATVRALWDEAPARSGLVGLLGVLVREGFDGLPPFALVALEGDRVHAALRGEVEVVVERADGPVVLRAGDVSTWTEQVVDDALAVRVRAGSVVPDAVALPVAEGVVRADSVSVDLAPAPVATGERAARRAAARIADVPTALPSEPTVLEPALPEPAASVPAVPEPALPEPAVPEPALPELDLLPVPADEAVVPEPADEPVEPAGDALGLEPENQEPVPAQADEPTALPALLADPTVDASHDTPADAADAVDAVDPWVATASWAGPDDTAAVEPAPHDLPQARTASGVVEAAEALLLGEAPVPASSADDHDGLTIMSSDLAAIRDQLPAWAAETGTGTYPQVPVVTGALPLAAVAPSRRLVLSTGLVVSLDRAVLLGRAPQVSRVANRELPRLVTVPSPQQDISRTHAEVRVEGDDVLVTDLGSTNGVQVQAEGAQVRRLHPGEPTRVAEGETVDLGDGVTFTVERSS